MVVARVAVALLSLSFAGRALAHGPPPGATAPLVIENEQATVVSLTRGLAHRTQSGFRFVCPETWGGDATAPLGGIPGGPAAVASEKLFLVDTSGHVTSHPSEVGTGVALASNRDTLFGLFEREGQHELLRITTTTSDLVRTLDERFFALAASDSELSLLSWTGSTLVLQTLSMTGELGKRVTWTAPSVVAFAELRIAGGQLYVFISGSAAPWITLGRATEQGYEQLVAGGSDIDGPLALDTGTYVARDGAFEPLLERVPVAGSSDYLTCLGSRLGVSYACSHGDLMRVDHSGLGAALFTLSALEEPSYDGLSERASQACNARWLDLRDHVAQTALMSARDAGVVGMPAQDGGARNVGGPDAATAATPVESAASDGGCTLGGGTLSGAWTALWLLVPALRRRRR